MFSLAKAIVIGSGTVAVATGAYVIEAPQAKVSTSQSVSDATLSNVPTANVPIFQASSKPVVMSPVTVAPQACANGSVVLGACFGSQSSSPSPAAARPDPSTGIITVPSPAPAPVSAATVPAAQCASLSNPAWAANGPVNLTDTICPATRTCDSLLKPSDDTKNDYPMLTAGKRYYVTPRTDGVTLPNGAPRAVVAVPADGPMPTTMNQVFAATCFQ